jgi:hypothetical protein
MLCFLLIVKRRKRLDAANSVANTWPRHRNRRQLKEAQLEMLFEATELPSCEILIFAS